MIMSGVLPDIRFKISGPVNCMGKTPVMFVLSLECLAYLADFARFLFTFEIVMI